MVHEMQRLFYDDAAYIVTGYNHIGQAYRTDRFACFEPQPATDGPCCSSTGSTTT